MQGTVHSRAPNNITVDEVSSPRDRAGRMEPLRAPFVSVRGTVAPSTLHKQPWRGRDGCAVAAAFTSVRQRFQDAAVVRKTQAERGKVWQVCNGSRKPEEDVQSTHGVHPPTARELR